MVLREWPENATMCPFSGFSTCCARKRPPNQLQTRSPARNTVTVSVCPGGNGVNIPWRAVRAVLRCWRWYRRVRMFCQKRTPEARTCSSRACQLLCIVPRKPRGEPSRRMRRHRDTSSTFQRPSRTAHLVLQRRLRCPRGVRRARCLYRPTRESFRAAPISNLSHSKTRQQPSPSYTASREGDHQTSRSEQKTASTDERLPR